jgi:hypothetical protein
MQLRTATFWKEKATGPKVVRSNMGLDSGFG